MKTTPAPTIRLHLDPTNTGQFLACCGILELADRAWGGAEGWFEEHADFFCLAPIERDASRGYGAGELLAEIRQAELSSALMSSAERRELEELDALAKQKGSPRSEVTAEDARSIEVRRLELESRWEAAKDGPLYLAAPFDIRLDWHLDDRSGAGDFKTWAGQQTITQIAFELHEAIRRAAVDDGELEWLFARIPCDKGLHIDATSSGLDVDIGFSLDPLKISAPEKRVLVELLALVGLQRFAPRRPDRERIYVYAAWFDPLVPEIAHVSARGLGASPARLFTFRLHFRSKYLKSFLPAQSKGDRR
jgi:CRISPR-associated protein Csb3